MILHRVRGTYTLFQLIDLHRSIPGIDRDDVFSSNEVLSGISVPGQRVVVVVDASGTWEAVETAEYLADKG
jgi:hypothetical protein